MTIKEILGAFKKDGTSGEPLPENLRSNPHFYGCETIRRVDLALPCTCLKLASAQADLAVDLARTVQIAGTIYAEHGPDSVFVAKFDAADRLAREYLRNVSQGEKNRWIAPNS